MMRLNAVLLSLTLVMGFAGCGKEEPLYEGKPMSDWIKALFNHNPKGGISQCIHESAMEEQSP